MPKWIALVLVPEESFLWYQYLILWYRYHSLGTGTTRGASYDDTIHDLRVTGLMPYLGGEGLSLNDDTIFDTCTLSHDM